ncbi:hypothetical protein [Amycolatopsis anabasis]|uniref:hypothetical protein n=1 Tax=Amycolatopsis anabasis TaxID=1840409 RepID=UPI00131B685C|nr:hypothetical protein [Amycolatopsis anabasis]
MELPDFDMFCGAPDGPSATEQREDVFTTWQAAMVALGYTDATGHAAAFTRYEVTLARPYQGVR